MMDLWKNNSLENWRITYTHFVCDHHPLKTEQYRVRLLVAWNRLVYKYDPGSPAASMIEINLLLNSVIYDFKQGYIFMRFYHKDFFLTRPMIQPEYTKIQIWFFHNIWLEIQFYEQSLRCICKYKNQNGIYGIKQAVILDYDNFV